MKTAMLMIMVALVATNNAVVDAAVTPIESHSALKIAIADYCKFHLIKDGKTTDPEIAHGKIKDWDTSEIARFS